MAEEGTDRKKIAELYFGYSKAYEGLEAIDKKLQELSKNSKTVFDKVQNGMEKSFSVGIDYSKIVNTQAVKKSLDKVTEISESQAKRLTTTINNEAIKTTGVKQREALKQETIEKNALAKKLLKEQDLANFKEKQAIKEEIRNKRIADSTETMYDKIANYAKTYLIYQGFNELRNAAKELITEMVEVENQMVQIDRVLNDSSLDINKYREQLIQLAYDYGNSFDNVADVTLRLAQAGFDAQQSLALTEKTLLALNTAELNATEATDDMVAIMSQWNLMTGTATEVSDNYASIIDKINRVADNFPTTSADILEALKRTSSAFNLAGVSIDETIASIVAAEKASQRGGKAIGTAMNSIVQQLRDTGKMATLEAMGLDVYTDAARTEFKSVIDILEQLSQKMEELTKAGKSNSAEMQDLLEVFSLYRRNVASSLLGEMAGEDSTYQQVLDMVQAYDTMGYSLQENEKYMKTAKAAQEQFNATLLELKTSIWDNGGEEVFRSLLLLGKDITSVFKFLIDTFGSVPTVIGLVTLAFANLSKNMKTVNLVTDKTTKEITEAATKSTIAAGKVNSLNAAYKAGTISATELKIATEALNIAMSVGLSVAITAVVTVLDKLIHLEENAIKKKEEIIRKSQENINSYQEERENIENLISGYEKLNSISEENRTVEQNKELKEIQKDIVSTLREHGEIIDTNNISYDEQIKKLKEISDEQLPQIIAEYEIMLDKYTELNKPLNDFYSFKIGPIKQGQIRTGMRNAGIDQDFTDLFAENINVQEQIDLLTQWQKKLSDARKEGENVATAYEWVTEKLSELNKNNKNVVETQEKLNELYSYSTENTEKYSDELEQLSNNVVNVKSSFNNLANNIEQLSANFDIVTKAANEFNSEGTITASTFKKVIENDLLQYLDLVNGKMVVSKQYFEEEAEALRKSAEATLKEEYAKEILQIVTGSLNKTIETTKTASEIGASGVNLISQQVINAANDFLKGKEAANQFNQALSNLAGKNLGNVVSNITKEQKVQLKEAENSYNKRLKMINSLSASVTKASKTASSGASKAAKDSTKTFEEQSQERVKIFKKEIDNLESLESSWVNKYKKLELFSTDDLKFITHQRINRYNEYLNQINQLQGISEEDRTELVREYSSKRQEAELEYFDLLKQQLDEQIKAFQEANNQRIQQIKDEAQAQIDALQKVEDENDRIRQKEEYLRKRDELIHGNQGIEYWQQRTGREAQIALAEAQKELEDLDRDWEEKKQEWNLDDQVEQIEKARDAQIAAIEEAQEQQIQGWKNAYEAQVQLYAQTGQIIYDNSVINAGYLYNAYMDNFVTPFNAQIQNVVNSINQASVAADNVINKMNSISGGGGSVSTVSSVANKALSVHTQQVSSGHVPSAVAASHIGPTQTLKSFNSILANYKKTIGKFHGGGMVGSSTEALALLRPKEVVLTPEWAARHESFNKIYK